MGGWAGLGQSQPQQLIQHDFIDLCFLGERLKFVC